MKNLAENKYFTFSLGLVLGIFLTIFVFYSFRDIVKNELEKMGIHFSKESDSTNVEDDAQELAVKNKNAKKKVYSTKSSIADSTVVDSVSAASRDTLLASDMSSIGAYTNDGDVTVATDELLFTKFIVPSGVRNKYFCESNDNLDSTLVNNPSKKQEGLMVEFWRSPVNFRGYKLTRKKLVIFGVYAYDSVVLAYGSNNQIVMKYNGREYNLRCAEDFVPTIFFN